MEGYSSGKENATSSSSLGRLVPARTRSKVSLYSLRDSEEDLVEETVVEIDEEEGDLTHAGPSIRVITQPGEKILDEVEVRRSGSLTVVEGDLTINDKAKQNAMPSSSSSKSIYPWKRIVSSSSIAKTTRSSSSCSSAAPAVPPSEDAMTLEEFGSGEASQHTRSSSQKGSIGNLKKWLSRTGSSSSIAPENRIPSIAPQLPPLLTSPVAKRKRETQEEEEAYSSLSLQASPEVPIKRAIKARPSRTIKADVASSSLPPTSQADLSKAANKVLEEMNARLVQNGKASLARIPSQGTWSVSSGAKPPVSPLKSIQNRTKGRFSGEHAKNFVQMDSIVNHYAAKRSEQTGKERSTSSSSTVAAKRIKIEETKKELRSEDQAVNQRKLELAKQRRKSAARRVSTGRRSVSHPVRSGFKNKISGAVRDIVGVARVMASGDSKQKSATPSSREVKRPSTLQNITNMSANTSRVASSSSTFSSSKSRHTFDLKASLARKPTGYKPYSAKETVQLLQIALPGSPSKAAMTIAPPTPIRSGWTMVEPSTSKHIASSSSTIAFPCTSPAKTSPKVQVETAIIAATQSKQLQPSPLTHRRSTMQNVPIKKTRSSISNARQGQLQADRLRRAARANEMKHQTSMAARRKTGAAIQRAVDHGEKVVARAAMSSGTGRGSPRKSSARIIMEGEGRGTAGLKRIN